MPVSYFFFELKVFYLLGIRMSTNNCQRNSSHMNRNLSTTIYSPLPSNKSNKAIRCSTEYSNHLNSNSSNNGSNQLDNRLFVINRTSHPKHIPWQGTLSLSCSKVIMSSVQEVRITGSRPIIKLVDYSSLTKMWGTVRLRLGRRTDCGLKVEQSK